MPVVFDTMSVEPPSRFDAYCDALRQTYFEMDISTAAPERFAGRLDLQPVGDLFMGAMTGSAGTVSRHPLHTRQSGFDGYFLNLQVAGPAMVHQDGRTAELRPTDLVLVHGERPFRFEFPDQLNQLSLALPRAALGTRLAQFCEHGVGTRLPREAPIAQLLASALRTTATIDGLEADDSAPVIQEHVLALLYSASRAFLSAPQAEPAAAEQKVFRLIRRHLTSTSLSLDLVASEAGVSRRYIQLLFHRRGETFSSFVRRSRIEHCQLLMRLPQHQERSISELAFASGFADLSTFSRAFLTVTGKPASRHRARLLP